MAIAKKGAAKKSAGGRSGSGAAKKSTSAKSGSSAGGRSGGAAKKSAGAAKKSGGTAKKAGAAKRTPNAAFMKAMTPSEQLGRVVGTSPMPRTEITKKLWDYIKKNKLQDPKARRMINADENLRPIFKKDQVSMFDMTKLVNKHLSDGNK